MAAGELTLLRVDRLTDCLCFRATRREAAARREVVRAGRQSLDALQCARHLRRSAGTGAERWCTDAQAQRRRPGLVTLSTIRPAYITETRLQILATIAHVGVMKISETRWSLNLFQQVQILRLNGDVERRRRLVTDQHPRRARDADRPGNALGECRRSSDVDSLEPGAQVPECAPSGAFRRRAEPEASLSQPSEIVMASPTWSRW